MKEVISLLLDIGSCVKRVTFPQSPLFTFSTGILFSIYVILCLRGAFRNITPHITGKGL